MKTRVKLTKAKIESLKHPVGKHPSKHFDLLCEGHAVFVMPQPSLKKAHYAHWSTLTYDATGKQKRSGRYKYICRFGHKSVDAVKAEIITNLPIWKAGNITSNSIKTVGSLVAEYIADGAGGFRVKAKGAKLKYKKNTTDNYIICLNSYVLVKTKKESVKEMLTAPYKQSDNSYYKKQLAELPLDKITKKDIEVWHSRMELIPTAANRALAALSVVFEWDSNRLTPSYKGLNPCLRVSKYVEKKDKRWIDSTAKVLEIVKYCQDQQWRDPHFLTFYLLLLECGERITDAMGIAWRKPTSLAQQKKCTGWIDWKSREIYFTDTKNREDANIEITDELFMQLEKLQNLVSESNSNASWAVGSMWVFPRATNLTQHVNESSYRCKLRDFNYKFGNATREHIRGTGKRKVYKYTNLLTLKHLRKTFVTTYGRKYGLEKASQRMRHSSPVVTKEHYYNEDTKALKTQKSIYDVWENMVQLKVRTDEK